MYVHKSFLSYWVQSQADRDQTYGRLNKIHLDNLPASILIGGHMVKLQ